MAANHASELQLQKLFVLHLLTILKKSSTAIDTPKHKISYPCVGIYGW